MKNGWILFMAGRYLKASRRDKGLSSAVLSIVSLTLGVMALLTVLGVMNGFQLGFMENILEVSSTHLRISTPEQFSLPLEDKLKALPGIRSLLPLVDSQTLVKSSYSSPQGAFIRGLPPQAWEEDEGLKKHLTFLEGSWDLAQSNNILLGSEMSRRLGVSVGDSLSLLALTGPKFSLLQPRNVEFTITGIFKTGYLELDAGWAFIPLESALEFFAGEEDLFYGIKLENPELDYGAMDQIKPLLPPTATVQSWREYNSSFFGALRMEKTAMMILIGLIFIIVGGNIFQSLRRTLREREEEIGLLKAVGGSGSRVRFIFLFEGFIIGLVSGTLGVVLGLLLSGNINEILSGTQTLVSFISHLGASEESLSGFTSQLFYLDRIPVRILTHEVVLVFVFAILSSTISSWLATRTVEDIKPATVLRAE